MNTLSVIHWARNGAAAPPDGLFAAHPTALVFETCQRVILIEQDGRCTESSQGVDALTDAQAYGLLLEVLCGLRSRVVGETEVQGQFRDFCRKHRGMASWERWLLEDAKTVRSALLGEPGLHSYGGVVRRWCTDRRDVLILGTGLLAQKVHRNVPGATMVKSRGLIALPDVDAVVIAAPIDDATLERLRREMPRRAVLWVDLRGERRGFIGDRDLDDVYAELEKVSAERRKLIPSALQLIETLSRARFERPVCRPWGWEDLVA